MMYNYRKYLYLLRHAYFHSSRDNRYPSEAVKNMTFRAMQMLWQLDGLYALGKFFDGDEIHRLLIEELMPDDVDMALSYFLHRCRRRLHAYDIGRQYRPKTPCFGHFLKLSGDPRHGAALGGVDTDVV